MGKRISISTPTVISTELPPLSDFFDVVPSDTLEQWYYVNSGEYSPDRHITSLFLTPVIKVVDESSGQLYSPSFQIVNWYYLDPTNTTDYSASDALWPGRGFVKITAVEYQEGVDYYCPVASTNPNRHLVVTKNVPPPTGSIGGTTLCCVARYIDPRDSGVVYMVRKTITLSTNQDATIDIINVSLQCPPSQKFNVFTSNSSIYTISAKILGGNNEDVTTSHYIEWYGVLNGGTTEVLLDTLDCYKQATQANNKGQGTDTVKIDAMYSENITIICRVRKTTSASSDLLSDKAYTSIVWEYPKMDAYAVCDNGDAIGSLSRNMTFRNIINIKSQELTDEQKALNLLVNWKSRISTSQVYADLGWGQSFTISSDALKQTTSYSTPVHSEVYMLGAYEQVVDNGEVVLDNNETVFDRK